MKERCGDTASLMPVIPLGLAGARLGTRASSSLQYIRPAISHRTVLLHHYYNHHHPCAPRSSPNLRTRLFTNMAPNAVERVAEKLEAPDLDDRSYRVICLANKLEALLVSDPETDKASASVSIDAGSFSDADDIPGMAHAVEHLLFMGTKKVCCSHVQYT